MEKNMKLKTGICISDKKIRVGGGFTIIELVVALSVFSVIMLAVLTFFNTASDAWTRSTQRSMIYENARVAMDMITRDLQSFMYDDFRPFWHYAPSDYTNPPTSWNEHRYGGIAFISRTPLPPNDNCMGEMCKVKYELAYDGEDEPYRGWLRRSVEGPYLPTSSISPPLPDPNPNWTDINKKKGKWVVTFNNNGTTAEGNLIDGIDNDGDGYVDEDGNIFFSANCQKCNDTTDPPENCPYCWHKVIPYVTKLVFSCYKYTPGTSSSFVEIEPFDISQAGSANPDAAKPMKASEFPDNYIFPRVVRVQLSLLDKNSWNKWIKMGGDINAFNEDAAASGPAYEFRKKHERTFTKLIFLE